MIQTYYAAEYEFDSNNRLVPKKGKNKNAILFEGGDRLVTYDSSPTTTIKYKALKIATDKVFFDQTQGQHPVLHMSFKELCSDLKSFEERLYKRIGKAYQSHRYLPVSTIIKMMQLNPNKW
jgi:hypothetical protein